MIHIIFVLIFILGMVALLGTIYIMDVGSTLSKKTKVSEGNNITLSYELPDDILYWKENDILGIRVQGDFSVYNVNAPHKIIKKDEIFHIDSEYTGIQDSDFEDNTEIIRGLIDLHGCVFTKYPNIVKVYSFYYIDGEETVLKQKVFYRKKLNYKEFTLQFSGEYYVSMKSLDSWHYFINKKSENRKMLEKKNVIDSVQKSLGKENLDRLQELSLKNNKDYLSDFEKSEYDYLNQLKELYKEMSN